jgi:ABC-type sugar transport system, permease component
MANKRKFSDYILRVILFLWAATILFPLLWIVNISLNTNREFFQSVWSFPETIQWLNYIKAWNSLGIGQSFLNTIYYVGTTLIISIFITTLNSYAMTRLEWKGRKFIMGLIMLSLFLPGINALIPQYVLMRNIGLTNSLTGLVILSGLAENVFSIMLMGGFMQSLPKEIEESASIDGASIFQTFRKIILPLVTPGIVTIAIINFLGLYNNFLQPLIYLSDPKKYTIGVAMYQANQRMMYKADWVTLCAGIVIVIIPSAVIYVLFQKQVMEGATLGAIKG